MGNYHVKFGHFVNFSYIVFGQKCLIVPKLIRDNCSKYIYPTFLWGEARAHLCPPSPTPMFYRAYVPAAYRPTRLPPATASIHFPSAQSLSTYGLHTVDGDDRSGGGQPDDVEFDAFVFVRFINSLHLFDKYPVPKCPGWRRRTRSLNGSSEVSGRRTWKPERTSQFANKLLYTRVAWVSNADH